MGRAPGPLLPPTISQSMPAVLAATQFSHFRRIGCSRWMTAPVPLLTANGRCGLGEGTFATTRGKGRDAP